MKIRNGFVSNSSSSSFCIFGVSTYNLPKASEIAQKADEKGMLHGGGDVGEYIGLEYTEMEMDETRRQFENRVKDEINKLMNEVAAVTLPEQSFGVCSEAWYNG
jgi:isopentenyl phosphate kinase